MSAIPILIVISEKRVNPSKWEYWLLEPNILTLRASFSIWSLRLKFESWKVYYPGDVVGGLKRRGGEQVVICYYKLVVGGSDKENICR